MAQEQGERRFVNQQLDWNFWGLIHDEEPQIQRQRERCQNERQWSLVSDRHESEAMGLSAFEQERVFQSYFKLREMSRSERRKAVRSDPYTIWHTYRNPDLAELLLVESERSLLDEDPACAAEAETAEWIVDEIYAPEAVELKAFARTLQAAARHLFGDHQGGDELFRSALDALGECPAPMPWAYFFRTLSRARERQDRLPEAAAWLALGCGFYRMAGYSSYDTLAAQWCLRRLARLHLRLNEPDRALAALAQIKTGEHSAPEIEAEVLLGQAACLAAFDLREPARALLLASRERRRWIWYPWHRLPLEWWDARIALRLEDLEDAIPRFDAVRRQHLNHCNWAEACLASLDLLLAYERAGAWTRESRSDVFGELASGFDADRRSRKCLLFAEERAALESALREAAGRLGREGIPEARACQAFLDRVQSLPPARSRVALLFGRSGRRRGAGSDSFKLTRRERMRRMLDSRIPEGCVLSTSTAATERSSGRSREVEKKEREGTKGTAGTSGTRTDRDEQGVVAGGGGHPRGVPLRGDVVTAVGACNRRPRAPLRAGALLRRALQPGGGVDYRSHGACLPGNVVCQLSHRGPPRRSRPHCGGTPTDYD